MHLFADIGTGNLLTVGAIVVGAIVAFWLIHKVVKFVLSLVIVLIVAAAALFYCVHAGYISREDAEKLNPLRNPEVRQAVSDAKSWAGEKAKDAAQKAVDAAVREGTRSATGR